jgi:hypothetical protein
VAIEEAEGTSAFSMQNDSPGVDAFALRLRHPGCQHKMTSMPGGRACERTGTGAAGSARSRGSRWCQVESLAARGPGTPGFTLPLPHQGRRSENP